MAFWLSRVNKDSIIVDSDKWFDESNGKGQVRYGFNKTIKPYKQVKEYLVFDKIAPFEIKEYEADNK